MSPAVIDRGIAEPEHAILLAGPANEGIINLAVGQSLSRLCAEQCVDAFLQKMMPEIERHQCCHLVALIFGHALEKPLEVEILFQTACRGWIQLIGVTADVAPVLLAHVHPEPSWPQLLLKHFRDLGRHFELLAVAAGWAAAVACDAARNVSPKVEQIEIPTLDLVDHLPEIFCVDHGAGRPEHVAQFMLLGVVLHIFGEVNNPVAFHSEGPQSCHLRAILECSPVRRTHRMTLIVGMLAWIEQTRINLHGRGVLGTKPSSDCRNAADEQCRQCKTKNLPPKFAMLLKR